MIGLAIVFVTLCLIKSEMVTLITLLGVMLWGFYKIIDAKEKGK